MKIHLLIITFGAVMFTLTSVQADKTKNLPAPEIPPTIYTGYTDVQFGGPSKTSAGFYSNPGELIQALHKAKYLGADMRQDFIEEEDKKGSDVFDQSWTIVIDKQRFMDVRIWGLSIAKEVYCTVRFYDNITSEEKSTIRPLYYYKLPDRILEKPKP